jgi:DNA-binding NarL/FixJ family response regulator
MPRVLIVDDHPMVARYTRNEVAALIPDAIVHVAEALGEAETLMHDARPDFVLLDLRLPDSSGLSALVRIRECAPSAVVAIVTGETDPEVMRDCFVQGARGYVTKSTGADEFTDALRKLFQNGFYYPPQAAAPDARRTTHRLTRREVEVLRALAIGNQTSNWRHCSTFQKLPSKHI